jgi:hypothetical protein
MKKRFSIILFALALCVASCKKDFLSLENNPNTPSVSSPSLVLTGAEKVTADIVNINYSTYGVWMGYWSPSGNYVPNAALVQYNYTTDDYQVWTPLYSNLSNYNYIETVSATSAAQNNFQAIAKIMKAFNFQSLVDNYNNAPYTQAFQGLGNNAPTYDKGEDIYNDLIKQLDAAIALIKATPATAANPGTADIIFKGNMTSWVKFANTIKLRLILRQWNLTTKQAALKSAMSTTVAEGFIDESTPALANPGYTNSDANGGQQSPFWRSYGYTQNGNTTSNYAYYRANSYAVGVLSSFNDARLTAFYAPIPNGTIVGNAFGDANSRPNASISAIGPGLLKSASMDANIFSSAQSLFLQSEAAMYGLITGDAKNFYQRGITASYLASGLTAAQAVTYYEQPIVNVNWNASTDKLQAIITQKWIALNGYNNLEAYNEYRRTGYPNVPRSVASGANGTTLPSRIFYPTSEYQQNAASVAAQGTIDRFTSKIFWAK